MREETEKTFYWYNNGSALTPEDKPLASRSRKVKQIQQHRQALAEEDERRGMIEHERFEEERESKVDNHDRLHFCDVNDFNNLDKVRPVGG